MPRYRWLCCTIQRFSCNGGDSSSQLAFLFVVCSLFFTCGSAGGEGDLRHTLFSWKLVIWLEGDTPSILFICRLQHSLSSACIWGLNCAVVSYDLDALLGTLTEPRLNASKSTRRVSPCWFQHINNDCKVMPLDLLLYPAPQFLIQYIKRIR